MIEPTVTADITFVCGDVPPGEDVWPTGERCQLPKGHEGSHVCQERNASGTMMERSWRVTESCVMDGVGPATVLRTKAPATLTDSACDSAAASPRCECGMTKDEHFTLTGLRGALFCDRNRLGPMYRPASRATDSRA